MPNPDLIPVPFAQDGDKNPIPLERIISDPVNRATWLKGFPPDTRIPKEVGGEAPDGLDFNGLFNALSQAVVFLQKGNAYQFDAALAPYPIGALVRSNDDLTTYQSTVPNNSNNPNSNMSGWRVYNGSGFIVDNLTTNDSAKVLSAAQGKALQDNKLEANKVGASNGVASLDANTKVPVSQLPAATISDAGVLRFATAAEIANRANVSAAITPANVGQTFGQSLNQNGWCKLPNGLIMQWGLVYVGDNQTIDIDLPTSFLSFFVPIVSLSDFANGGNNIATVAVKPNGLSKITVKTEFSYSTQVNAYWHAIGY